jgi:hypothetical protein
MIKPLRLAATACVLLPIAAAAAAADPAELFGAREGVLDISLSPSGNKLAYLAPGPGQSTHLYTVNIAAGGDPKLAGFADGQPERLTNCGWVSETRLACTVYAVAADGAVGMVGATRLVAFDEDGKNLKLLSRPNRPDDAYVSYGGGSIIDWNAGTDGSVLMARNYVPEAKIDTRLVDKREGMGVDRIDTADLSAKPIEAPRRNAGRYYSDGHGNIRLHSAVGVAGTGYENGKITYFYRTKSARDWKEMGTRNALTDDGFYPIAVDPALDVAFGLKRHQGRDALFSIALRHKEREPGVRPPPRRC